MKKNYLYAFSASAAFALLGGVEANAQSGQPHTLTAESVYRNVKLNWKKPTEKITLQWHDGEDYNGIDGKTHDPEGAVEFQVASRFTASELTNYAGLKVDSIGYFEYREVYKVSVLIYEDGKVVCEKEANLEGFQKSAWRFVKLDEPYVIPEGKTVMFAVKFTAGTNMSFVANCDRTATIGKGNLYSYDGKEWASDAPGDFLITACLHNDATDVPDGYNVYRDGQKVNEELIPDTTAYALADEPEGEHVYSVSAQYGNDEKKSYGVTASPISASNVLPPVATVSAEVDNLAGTIKWQAPLKRGSEMTWSNKEYNQAIGGTSKTSPVVWIKQDFSADDMAAFPNNQITAINAFVGPEGGITDVTMFVMKDGAIDYYENISADSVSAIKANEWNKFVLSAPYKMELGNAYAFGICYKHTASLHPVGVDAGEAVNSKGNVFSVSSISSKGFNQTKPTWKTLASGGISGNFMLTADVEALSDDASAEQKITAYDVYRDGKKIAADVEGTSYTDNVDNLGLYVYEVVAKNSASKKSVPMALNVTYSLPAEYAAPTILDKEQDGKKISFDWSSSAYQMQHYGTAKVMTGFDEDMSLMYGAKFTKEELADYAGYKMRSIKFAIGANIGAFKTEIRTSDNEVLYSKEYAEGDIEPGYIYQVTFDKDEQFTLPSGKDLYLVYNATLPGGSKAIILDGGPAVDGGAMVSLTGGSSWMKMGTIASELKDYNIVISALAVAQAAGDNAQVKAVEFGDTKAGGTINLADLKTISMGTVDREALESETNGVEADKPALKSQEKTAEKPQPACFRIYRNGELVTETENTNFEETLDRYGVFDYYVTTVYSNGWESPASTVLNFRNTIRQSTAAPYNLEGKESGTTLKLSWKAATASPELTYQQGENDTNVGMTSSNPEGYHAIKFTADEMKDKVGEKIAHVKFKLAAADKITSASVFVMYGENIIREQEITLDSLKDGWNDVALNVPVEIVSGQDIGVGYHITYPKGQKPCVCDDGAAVSGYGDLISSSATPGYWYSLAAKFKIDHNWRICAVLQKADAVVKRAAATEEESDTTYNVYRDGNLIASGIQGLSYDVVGAESGKYTVTEIVDNKESNESNAVEYIATAGISNVSGEARLSDGKVFSIDGSLLGNTSEIDKLPAGVYIINGKKIVK